MAEKTIQAEIKPVQPRTKEPRVKLSVERKQIVHSKAGQKIKKSRFGFGSRSKNGKHGDKPASPKKKKKRSIWIKEITLGTVNAAFVIGLVLLLTKIPQKANQIKILRNQSLFNTSSDDVQVQQFELDRSKESFDKLRTAFPDDDGLIKFVAEIEKLKTEGVVVGFSFASKDPVSDKTKLIGLPIIVEFEGSWKQIATDIERIQKLPYAFRPVTIDAEEIPEDGYVKVKYGGFLYVDESMEKN